MQTPSAANEPNLRCPECGYEMWAEMRGTPGVEFSFLWFCPLDHHAMIRKDALGEIEAAQRDGRETFEEYVRQEHVLGVIEAEVPRGDE